MMSEKKNVVLQLAGLSCSCETKMVEKRLKALKGVDFEINPISYKVKLAYDPDAVTMEEIQKAVAKAGAKSTVLPSK